MSFQNHDLEIAQLRHDFAVPAQSDTVLPEP